ncbi:MAG: DNA polymerase domain-containing protein [Anaerolineales bacterium]
MLTEHAGWLLDVYADRGKGVVLWLVGQDGRRYRFTQNQAATFYVGGEQADLSTLCAYLKKRAVHFRATQRRHLFHGAIEVIAVHVARGATQRSLFRKLHDLFPQLDYYDADLSLPVHYFAATNTFPMAYSTVAVDEHARIARISARDDKWSLKPMFPALRLMEAEPTSSPVKALPASIRVTFNNQTETLSTKNPLHLLQRFSQLIELHDPDIIRTRFGDMWLFPYLFSISKATGFPFNPNRDKTRAPIRVEANQFESYGRLVHRDQQTLLLGRLHLDPQNSMAFKDWGLYGTFETARLSNLPIQNAARRSAGGAFVGMQVAASLEQGILIPIRKRQRERFKKATQLIAADNGGVIFKPLTGLHANVAEIDFFSMYPHIMTGWNISAETVGARGAHTRWAPGIDAPINQDRTGIVASILKPIMAKRKAVKDILEGRADKRGYDLTYLRTIYEFLKGLGWVSYGYQGFSGNRIGSIEAHEAINAVSRDVILQAKEAAEELGFEVLHLYVDSLFIRVGKNEARLPELLEKIKGRTGLRVDLEGILRWIAFLPSKQNGDVPVPNCYFGAFSDGELKCRGIMARRGDTPHYIADVQMEAIHAMARETGFDRLHELIPKLVHFFKHHYAEIAGGRVPVARLVISQTLSRDVEDFKVISPAGRAALQLVKDGRSVSAGQNVDFVRVKRAPFALSWHLVNEDRAIELDTDWYGEQLLRAADEILQPLGVPKEVLKAWLTAEGAYWRPEDYIRQAPLEMPLLQEIVHQKRERGYLPLHSRL